MNAPKPFRQDDAPGRIPESLIDAMLDGAVDDRTRHEVSRALRHDASRQRDVRETIEALDALRQPIDCPDLTGDVLSSLDRKHRFLPARARRAVRQARLGVGLAALLALGAVAVGQRAIPRLASIGEPATPVSDVAQALRADAGQAADGVLGGARLMRASVPVFQTGASQAGPLLAGPQTTRTFTLERGPAGGELPFGAPGARRGDQYRFDIDRGSLGNSTGPRGYRMVTIDGGRFFIFETPTNTDLTRWTTTRGGVSIVSASYAWSTQGRDDADHAPQTDARSGDGSSGRGGWVAEELP